MQVAFTAGVTVYVHAGVSMLAARSTLIGREYFHICLNTPSVLHFTWNYKRIVYVGRTEFNIASAHPVI